jgi:branched-subunit amino acid aminotransferase/4-amino-4-deoxychorismate lyase
MLPTLPTALLYGFSVYTSFALPLDETWVRMHLQRLEDHSHQVGFDFPWPQDTLVQTVLQLLPTENAIVRLTVFPEVDDFTSLIRVHPQARLPALCLLSTRPKPSVGNGKPSIEPGLRVRLIDYERPFPQIKHGSLVGDFLHRRLNWSDGADDVVWTNRHGHITEASTANLIAFDAEGTIRTPNPARDGCLAGITWYRLLQTAEQLAMPVNPSPVTATELKAMDGVILTNAVQGIRTVVRVDEADILWSPQASRLLNELQERFNQPTTPMTVPGYRDTD